MKLAYIVEARVAGTIVDEARASTLANARDLKGRFAAKSPGAQVAIIERKEIRITEVQVGRRGRNYQKALDREASQGYELVSECPEPGLRRLVFERELS